MGCLWSSEVDVCQHCSRRAVNNLVIVDNVCECCIRREAQRARAATEQAKACYGEYRCTNCGRRWNSLSAWSDKFQECKRCKRPVTPHNLRDLLPSDWNDGRENVKEHPKELCQKCQELGRYCGNVSRQVSRTPGKRTDYRKSHSYPSLHTNKYNRNNKAQFRYAFK